jgi:hypothetical protein
MKLLKWFLPSGHKCHWGIPHRNNKQKALVQTCYECGEVRTVKVSFQTQENQ